MTEDSPTVDPEALTRREVNILVQFLSVNPRSARRVQHHLSSKALESLSQRGFLEKSRSRHFDDRGDPTYALAHKGRARLGRLTPHGRKPRWLSDLQTRILVHILNGQNVTPNGRDLMVLAIESLVRWKEGGQVDLTDYGREFLLTGSRYPRVSGWESLTLARSLINNSRNWGICP